LTKTSALVAAHAISLSRALASFGFVSTALTEEYRWLSLCFYIYATLSDLVDGRIAKISCVTSDLGRSLDMFGDKFLTLASAIYFVARGFSPFPALLISLRDILLLALRTVRVQGEILILPTKPFGAWTILPVRIITPVLVLARNPSALLADALSLSFWITGLIFMVSLTVTLKGSWQRILTALGDL
jgi:phosphatidylglycerophosphate synthase